MNFSNKCSVNGCTTNTKYAFEIKKTETPVENLNISKIANELFGNNSYNLGFVSKWQKDTGFTQYNVLYLCKPNGRAKQFVEHNLFNPEDYTNHNETNFLG